MTCQHLAAAGDPAPQSAYEDGCPRCVADGFTGWVHLRLCLSCGAVRCCDSSPNQHASKHARKTGHPIVRSMERGENWMWCYVDEVYIQAI